MIKILCDLTHDSDLIQWLERHAETWDWEVRQMDEDYYYLSSTTVNKLTRRIQKDFVEYQILASKDK